MFWWLINNISHHRGPMWQIPTMCWAFFESLFCSMIFMGNIHIDVCKCMMKKYAWHLQTMIMVDFGLSFVVVLSEQDQQACLDLTWVPAASTRYHWCYEGIVTVWPQWDRSSSPPSNWKRGRRWKVTIILRTLFFKVNVILICIPTHFVFSTLK